MVKIFTRSKTKRRSYIPSPTSSPHEALPSPVVDILLEAWDSHDWQYSSDALTDWLNGRWKKSGYQVSKETVCFELRTRGRDARPGLGDKLEGAYVREALAVEKQHGSWLDL